MTIEPPPDETPDEPPEGPTPETPPEYPETEEPEWRAPGSPDDAPMRMPSDNPDVETEL